MCTPHLSRQLVFSAFKMHILPLFYCNLHIASLQHEHISVRRHTLVLGVMTYCYDVRIQVFMVYALSAIKKHCNLLGWQQHKVWHSSMQTSRNPSLMEANAKLFNFLGIHALIMTKLLLFYKKYARLECVHHDDLNYVHQVVVCHN